MRSILLFTIYYALCLVGFLPGLAFGYPKKGALLKERDGQGSVHFLMLLTNRDYELGRVWFFPDPANGRCQFVPWKDIDVVFAYKNTARHTVILIQSEAGGIICNIAADMIHRLSRFPGEQLFKNTFLGENGKLGSVILEAKTYITSNYDIYVEKGDEYRAGLFECGKPLVIYAIQIWTGQRKAKNRIINENSILIVQDNLNEAFGYNPDIYTFDFGHHPKIGGIAPLWTCAIWQPKPTMWLPIPGDPNSGSEETTHTTTKLYLGGTGNPQGGTETDRILRIREVVEVFLYVWTPIVPEEKNGRHYTLSAFSRGLVWSKLQPWTLLSTPQSNSQSSSSNPQEI